MPLIALTRAVPDAISRCELTHLPRVPIDLPAAVAQHAEYERVLTSLGCDVRHITPTPELPDSVFVEDAAIVLDEVAVITRPGAESRRAETASVADALAPYRTLLRMTAPATLDGGDVLKLGRMLYVGVGSRTNTAGAEQLAALVAPHGHTVRAIPIDDCLHLKSAVTEVAAGLILLNPAWVSGDAFAGHAAIDVDPGEPFGGQRPSRRRCCGVRVVVPADRGAPARRRRGDRRRRRLRARQGGSRGDLLQPDLRRAGRMKA